MVAIQGQPTSFSEYFLDYGTSQVEFRDGRVSRWSQGSVPLKARL